MGKPIIATTLSGLFLSSEPWRKAHEIGMKELADKSGMLEIAEKTHSNDYLKKVEQATEKIYPDLKPKERMKKRRKIYFSRVIELIKENPNVFCGLHRPI